MTVIHFRRGGKTWKRQEGEERTENYSCGRTREREKMEKDVRKKQDEVMIKDDVKETKTE